MTSLSGEVTAIMDSVGTVVDNGIDWMGQFLESVTGNAVLTTFVIAIPLVGLGVGLLKRLIHTRG